MKRRIAMALMLVSAAAAGAPEDGEPAGTTIVGEREAAVGLYLAPWRDEQASDLDRPPGLYDVPLQALDPQRFELQADYDEAIRAYRHERLYRSR